MTKPSQVDQMLEIMYQALGEPIGLLVSTNDLRRAQAIFYAARKKAGDPGLGVLECRASPLEGGDFIIVKGQSGKKAATGPEELGL
jgi:hypothetical protein